MLRTHNLGHVPRVTALLGSVALVAPFMPWKLTKAKAADGTTDIDTIELKDGNPVWLDTNGAEGVIQGDTITRLNGEAATHRKDKEKAEAALKLFDGIDPAKAKEAIDTIGKLDKGKLLDAGKVDDLTNQIKAQFTEQLTAEQKINADLRNNLNKTKLVNAFSTSEFVKDKLALPMDVAQSYFSSNIEFDDNGNMSFKGADGNPVMSKARIGEKADFNEALAILVENNPNRDALMKGGNHQGSGNNGGGGGGKPGVKTYRRSEIDAMQATNPGGVAAAMAEVTAGTAQLTD